MEVETMISQKSRKVNMFYKLTFQAKANEWQKYWPKVGYRFQSFVDV